MSSIGKIQAHDAAMRLQECVVDSNVGWGAGVRLHVDTPLSGVQAKGFQGSLLGKPFQVIDVLIATIISEIKLMDSIFFHMNMHQISPI